MLHISPHFPAILLSASEPLWFDFYVLLEFFSMLSETLWLDLSYCFG